MTTDSAPDGVADGDIETVADPVALRLPSPNLLDLVARTDHLPTLPGVADRTLRIVDDPHASAAVVIDAVAADPATTVRLLRAAAAIGTEDVCSIRRAVELLGRDAVRDLAAAAARHTLGDDAAGGRFDRRGLWRHMMRVAAVARAVACHGGADGETAYVAGLLHDVGLVALERHLPTDFSAVVARCAVGMPLRQAEREILGFDHAELGGRLASRWGLPRPLVLALGHSHQPGRCPEDVRPLVGCVRVADFVVSAQDGPPVGGDLPEPPGARLLKELALDRRGFETLWRSSAGRTARDEDGRLQRVADTLFGAAGAGSTDAPASTHTSEGPLAATAAVLAPLRPRTLFLFDDGDRPVAQAGAGACPLSAAALRQLVSSRPEHLLLPGEVRSAWPALPFALALPGDAGLLVGSLDTHDAQAAEAVLVRLRPALTACAAAALRTVRLAGETRRLAEALGQLRQRYETHLERHRRTLAENVRQRDLRLHEQQQYLHRLEREVQARTAELAEKSQRLEKVNDRMTRDLGAAARIQRRFLPRQLHAVGPVRSAWHFDPCDELAGDSLGVLRLDEHTCGCYLLDVSGHGVAAALLSVSLSHALSDTTGGGLLKDRLDRPPHYELVSPPDVIAELNRRFPMDDATSQYFTMVYGMLDARSGRFRYASAGHPGIIHVPAVGPAVAHEVRSFAVGWMLDAEYEGHEIDLEPGDRLFLYSDGLSEMPGPDNEEFGVERMTAALARAGAGRDLQETVRRGVQAARDWTGDRPPNDDLSLVALEWLGPS